MKRKDYIPQTDAAFDPFQANLITQVTANAVPWNIMPALLAFLVPLQAAWAAAWAIAQVKVNRSPGAVATKNQARADYVAALRNFIQGSIYHNPVMTNGDIELCGLRPYDHTRTPLQAPDSLPIITVQYVPGNILEVRYYRNDVDTGAIHRGKPDGVSRLEFRYTYNGQPGSPDQCPFNADVSRNPIRVTVPPNMHGQTVWFYARWKNVKNEAGPWTNLDSFLL